MAKKGASLAFDLAPLTEWEEETMRADPISGMAKRERRWEDSGHQDQFALWGALFGCREAVPDWLYTALREMIERQIADHMPGHMIGWWRWWWTRYYVKQGLSATAASKKASEELAPTPAAGTPEAIRQTYHRVKKSVGES